MQKRKVLSVDFDDVVFDFNGHFAPWHNQEYGTSVTYEGIHSFSLIEVYDADPDIMLDRVRRFTHEMHRTVRPLAGALPALRRLSTKADLHIVTSRSETTHDFVEEWLSVHIPGAFSRLHFTNGYGGLHHHRKCPKSEVCDDIGALLHIDDAMTHADEVALNARIPVIVPDRPWNRAAPLPPGAYRAHSWDEIVSHIESLL